MMGPDFVGWAWRKWFTFNKKKFSWVMEQEWEVTIFTSGESLKAAAKCGATIASRGVSPLSCLSLSSGGLLP
jgi:hypothetical protein